MKIIDINVMLGPSQTSTRYRTAEGLINYLDDYHISSAVVCNSAAQLEPWLYNSEMDRISADSGGRILSCHLLDPMLKEKSEPGEGTLMERLKKNRPVAVRMYPMTQNYPLNRFFCDHILSVLNELHLPLLLNAEEAPAFADIPALARNFPNLPFVILRRYFNCSRSITPLLTKLNNVYFDVNIMIDTGYLEQFPGRIYGYISVCPGEGLDVLKKELKKYEKDSHFVGLKFLAGVHGSLLQQEYQYAADFANEKACVVLTHTWDNDPPYSEVEKLIKKRKRMKLLCAHQGGGNANSSQELAKIMKEYPNIYMETCGSLINTLSMEDLVALVNEDRIIYGSDLINLDVRYDFGRIVLSSLSEEVKEKLLSKNFIRLLNHLERLFKTIGYELTREELVKKVFCGKPSEIRKLWLENIGGSMLEFADAIEKAVHHLDKNCGKCKITIDNKPEITQDFYYDTENEFVSFFKRYGLSSGNHTIRIEILNEKNENSFGNIIAIAGFLVD